MTGSPRPSNEDTAKPTRPAREQRVGSSWGIKRKSRTSRLSVDVAETKANAMLELMSTRLESLAEDVSQVKGNWTSMQTALGRVIEVQAEHGKKLDGGGSSPQNSPQGPTVSSSFRDPNRASMDQSPRREAREDRGIAATDPSVVELLHNNKALANLMKKLKIEQRREMRGSGAGGRFERHVLHPDGLFRSVWDLILVLLLVFTCFVVPMRIGFPVMFSNVPVLWDAIDVFIEWYFVLSIACNFFTGHYDHTGRLVTSLAPIAKKYLRGFFWIDVISSIPLDTLYLAQGSSPHPLLRLNKIFRVVRLYYVVSAMRRSKRMQRKVDPGVMKLLELAMFLLLAWHYIGCFWWYIGDLHKRPVHERLRTLDANLFLSIDNPNYDDPKSNDPTLHYLASCYWAVMMTTGLNAPIGPGMREGQVVYECLVSFFGVCLQAYMLGATASEIANMDAQDSARRQKLNRIKQHLKHLRAPTFLRQPIMEYYERETTLTDEAQDSDLMRDMPTTLKVQLAVSLNAEFLRKVPFFAHLAPEISAGLVLCMRARVCLPGEIIIMQGDVSRALYFVRSGMCDVLRKNNESDGWQSQNRISTRISNDEGNDGESFGSRNVRGRLESSESLDNSELGTLLTTLKEHSCFGEQSFHGDTPAFATVRSRSYTTLMRIFKQDFEMVATMFPSLRAHVLGVTREQLRDYRIAERQATKKTPNSKLKQAVSNVKRAGRRASTAVAKAFGGAGDGRVSPSKYNVSSPNSPPEERASRWGVQPGSTTPVVLKKEGTDTWEEEDVKTPRDGKGENGDA